MIEYVRYVRHLGVTCSHYSWMVECISIELAKRHDVWAFYRSEWPCLEPHGFHWGVATGVSYWTAWPLLFASLSIRGHHVITLHHPYFPTCVTDSASLSRRSFHRCHCSFSVGRLLPLGKLNATDRRNTREEEDLDAGWGGDGYSVRN